MSVTGVRFKSSTSTERSCVVLATLRDSPTLNVEVVHQTAAG